VCLDVEKQKIMFLFTPRLAARANKRFRLFAPCLLCEEDKRGNYLFNSQAASYFIYVHVQFFFLLSLDQNTVAFLNCEISKVDEDLTKNKSQMSKSIV
jgi:hypothetical protein